MNTPSLQFLYANLLIFKTIVERHVVTIGGHNSKSYLSSVEVMDLKNRNKMNLPKLNNARAHHSCIIISDFYTNNKDATNAIICAGGISMGLTYSQIQSSVEILFFDGPLQTKNGWKTLNAKLNQVKYLE